MSTSLQSMTQPMSAVRTSAAPPWSRTSETPSRRSPPAAPQPPRRTTPSRLFASCSVGIRVSEISTTLVATPRSALRRPHFSENAFDMVARQRPARYRCRVQRLHQSSHACRTRRRPPPGPGETPKPHAPPGTAERGIVVCQPYRAHPASCHRWRPASRRDRTRPVSARRQAAHTPVEQQLERLGPQPPAGLEDR